MNPFIPLIPRTIQRTLPPNPPPRHLLQTITTMSTSTTTTTTTPPTGTAPKTLPKSQIPKGKTELKILMLHGYTQSGPLFSSKTKALSKLLTKALSPAPYNLHPTLIYPTGPFRLRPSDIPGYIPSDSVDEDEGDNWAWFQSIATGAYQGFASGMRSIATAIADAGGVDGVCGFSQGGAVAALVASALETPYREPSGTIAPDGDFETSWVPLLRAANNNAPLKFCVVYSGFYAPPPELQWLYTPPITTPTLHFLGSLDTVVEESRSQALVERCVDPTIRVHPGGHYVPVAKEWALCLAGWLRERYQEPSATKEVL
ncbi:serine hydrolase-domain-containing protein [Annulohypoxylon maeteangense]|uniref:serine hydrolase-domain-containing protein n=1 Tax=Annulohypoxylon maeteangense TaxID=1927788 RepID=UPI002007AEFA|nr:serine hydrolase-domain-containing protein [Annulohypoxylon maeteangense]KAI0883920.1 serine hydrolase-domain-containing protein [Annulohypoxylon maeteangense]